MQPSSRELSQDATETFDVATLVDQLFEETDLEEPDPGTYDRLCDPDREDDHE